MIALLGGLLRFLFALLVIRLVGRLVAGLLRRPGARAGAPSRGGDLVRDRVCNTFVPRETSLKAVVAGREEHFCSAACRDSALAAVREAS